MTNFIYVNDDAVAAGERAFELYLSALAMGPDLWDAEMGDLALLPGATSACVKRGIDRGPDIAAAVSRFAWCSPANVVEALRQLSDGPSSLLVLGYDGVYRLRAQIDADYFASFAA